MENHIYYQKILNLIACYHPSPRNVNTKLISEKMMLIYLKKLKKYLKFNTITKIRFKIIKNFFWNFNWFTFFIYKN
jgi:hypothetical protein